MSNPPPTHCHRCGGELDPLGIPGGYACPDCDPPVFHNPVPVVRLAVLDGDAVLLVEIAPWARIEEDGYDGGEWMLPGGHLHVDEQPAAGAARELAEETGLAVDPDDLVLADAITRRVVPDNPSLVVVYAVEAAAVSGTIEAASDAADARFWTPAGLADAADRFRDLADEPPAHRDLAGWRAVARSALSAR